MFDLSKALNDCLYSDLYKDVYGFRPRNVFFENQEQLDADVNYLCERLDEKLKEDEEDYIEAAAQFEARLKETQAIVINSTEEDAFRIMCQAKDITPDELDFYGVEVVEHSFGLRYGYLRDRFNIKAQV